jgi:hypothetical protein
MNDASEVQLGVAILLEAVNKHEVDQTAQAYKQFLISALEDFREGELEVYVLSLRTVGTISGGIMRVFC